ncbi:MAG: hypothetical protein ACOYM3_07120 [Terrimicrobiaceae bacterium]
MSKHKITFIGGGSYQWVPVLFRDLAVNPHLQNAEFVLHDIHPGRNAELAGICRIIAGKLISSVKVTAESDINKALAGAEAVILCISTGGLEAMEHDIEIPKKYGIYQPVGDSTGPGGISRTLRNVPVVTGLANLMEKLCPDAWLLNLSNPMGQIVRAIKKTSPIKVVGLCHEYMAFMDKVENLLGLEDWKRETSATIAGINHFAWITRLVIKGKDGLEILSEHLVAHQSPSAKNGASLVNLSETLSGDRVKWELFKIYGALPYPGDRHLVEFFPHFLSDKTAHGGDFGVQLTSIEDRRTTWMDLFTNRIAEWTNDDPNSIPRKPSNESLVPILAALLEGVPTIQPATLPNEGQVSNLPTGACVETLTTFERDAIAPHASGSLPDSVLALVHKHCLTQELTVDGAISGDRTKILQAMIADPLFNNNDFREVSQMLNELLEANADLLPQFSRCQKTVLQAA